MGYDQKIGYWRLVCKLLFNNYLVLWCRLRLLYRYLLTLSAFKSYT